MKYTVKRATTPQHLEQVADLVNKCYRSKGFIKYSVITPEDHAFVLMCQNCSGELLGTATIVHASDNPFPSETDYEVSLSNFFKAGWKKQNIIELKRYAKKEDLIANKSADMVFLSLKMATLEYLMQNSLTGWVASLKPYTYNMLTRIGLDLHILDVKPSLRHCLQYLDGNYFTDQKEQPRIVIGETENSLAALGKYNFLIERGTIQIDLSTQCSLT